MLLQKSIEHVSIVYTCNTYFVDALVHVIYSGVSGQCFHTILAIGTPSVILYSYDLPSNVLKCVSCELAKELGITEINEPITCISCWLIYND